MSTFTLAISCLTTSNLPWFSDLTFQVPMQYFSLQHQTLLLSPVTSTIGCCFCLGSVPSFILELFLHWSPVATGHLPIWGVHLSVSYLFAFSYCSWGSQGKNTEVVCHSLLQWTTLCQTWIFIGGTDAEAETPVFWPPDVKNRLTGKDSDTGKDWRQEDNVWD